MKNYLIFIITLITIGFAQAQSLIDALRYSTENINGTARYNALSGAFGALGGDLSALNSNPAGSAVFLNNSATATFSVLDQKNKSLYFNNLSQTTGTDFNLNQAGAVFVFNNNSENSGINKFTLAFNYEMISNYENEFIASGTSNVSIRDYFLNFAQGVNLSLLNLQEGETISELYSFLGSNEGFGAQQALLGFQSFIIEPNDPDDPNNTSYFSNIADGSFSQDYFYVTTGSNQKYTLNLAAQINDVFYIGINLNSYIIDYHQDTYLFEDNDNTNSSVLEVDFENHLNVEGTGFSAQIGGILKLGNYFRLGLTYDTPTWYTISEESIQFIETLVDSDGNLLTATVNPQIINVFEDYDIRSPGKITGSAAVLFEKKGLISIDYSFKDYSNIEFTSNDPILRAENTIISNSLQSAATLRIGGEYRLNQWRFRAGYRFEESPYKNSITRGDLEGYSAGLGFKYGNYTLDFSYARIQQDTRQALFETGLTTEALIDNNLDNFIFTFGFAL